MHAPENWYFKPTEPWDGKQLGQAHRLALEQVLGPGQGKMLPGTPGHTLPLSARHHLLESVKEKQKVQRCLCNEDHPSLLPKILCCFPFWVIPFPYPINSSRLPETSALQHASQSERIWVSRRRMPGLWKPLVGLQHGEWGSHGLTTSLVSHNRNGGVLQSLPQRPPTAIDATAS